MAKYFTKIIEIIAIIFTLEIVSAANTVDEYVEGIRNYIANCISYIDNNSLELHYQQIAIRTPYNKDDKEILANRIAKEKSDFFILTKPEFMRSENEKHKLHEKYYPQILSNIENGFIQQMDKKVVFDKGNVLLEMNEGGRKLFDSLYTKDQQIITNKYVSKAQSQKSYGHYSPLFIKYSEILNHDTSELSYSNLTDNSVQLNYKKSSEDGNIVEKGFLLITKDNHRFLPKTYVIEKGNGIIRYEYEDFIDKKGLFLPSYIIKYYESTQSEITSLGELPYEVHYILMN